MVCRIRRMVCVTSTSVLLIIYLAPSMILLASGAPHEAASAPISNLGQGFLDLNRNSMGSGKQHARPFIQGQSSPQQGEQQKHPLSSSDIIHPPTLGHHHSIPEGKINKRHPRQLEDEERRRPRPRHTTKRTKPWVTHPTMVTTSTSSTTPEVQESTLRPGLPPMDTKGPSFAYCAALCKEGLGGLACECDIVPIG